MIDKYKAACIEYAAASADVSRLGKVIGGHFLACYYAQCRAKNPAATEADFICCDVEFPEGHLKGAYAREGDGYGDTYFVNHDGDVEEYLAVTCVHCLEAHKAIQERKAAKQRYGIAKRRISVMGKAALRDLEQ